MIGRIEQKSPGGRPGPLVANPALTMYQQFLDLPRNEPLLGTGARRTILGAVMAIFPARRYL